MSTSAHARPFGAVTGAISIPCLGSVFSVQSLLLVLFMTVSQGFYSSVKTKVKEYLRSFSGAICFFPGLPFWTKLVYIGFKKCTQL